MNIFTKQSKYLLLKGIVILIISLILILCETELIYYNYFIIAEVILSGFILIKMGSTEEKKDIPSTGLVILGLIKIISGIAIIIISKNCIRPTNPI